MPSSIWITGPTRSGKTNRLIEWLDTWGRTVIPFPRSQQGSLPVDRRETARFPSPNVRILGNRGVLVFAANGDNRIALSDAILDRTRGQVPFDSATPLGFFETEINLFWPLIAQTIQSTVPFPLRLRPETEQELATRLWQQDLDQGTLQQDGVRDYYMVRRTLDLLQLGASAGVPIQDIPPILAAGMGNDEALVARWDCMGEVLQRWSSWCLERGLVTYGLISDLYWRILLPHPVYQRQVCRRYWAVFADDVDEYPAIAHPLFTLLLNGGLSGVFTFNPDGGIRKGLGADPERFAPLADRCDLESLDPLSPLYKGGLRGVNTEPLQTPPQPSPYQGEGADPLSPLGKGGLRGVNAEPLQTPPQPSPYQGEGADPLSPLYKGGLRGVNTQPLQTPPQTSPYQGEGADPLSPLYKGGLRGVNPPTHLAQDLGPILWQGVMDPLQIAALPSSLQCIQTVSRAELLRQLAEEIHRAVAIEEIAPEDIAVIGPGVDPIARYALREMLASRGIAVEALNEQRAIASSATVRALLSLMGLVYPGLGRLVNREDVAEMLVVLSQRPSSLAGSATIGSVVGSAAMGASAMGTSVTDELVPRIDPVRAGLIVDHCFQPDLLHPALLPVESFPRWDRLGYQGTQTYGDIRQWIETQRQQQQQRLLPNPVTLLDRAIQYFLLGGSYLPYDRLAVLRELMETAQHYWDVDARLRQQGPTPNPEPVASTVGRFMQLLRNGTITADPYPTRVFGQSSSSVTLATLFQYRANRLVHRWQFWLDAGSSLWLTGGEPLFGAPLFWQGWSGRLWTEADAQQASLERFRRNLFDLLGRATERVYLCHSDLATGGYEQTGPLLPIIERTISTRNI